MSDENVLDNRGDGDTSPSLLRRAQNNDRQALDRLVTLYVPLVNDWLRLASLPQADVEEVVQMVFLKVCEGLPAFDHRNGQGSFRGWLRVITNTAVAELYRKKPREQAEGGTDHGNRIRELPEPDEQQLTQETQRLFNRALELLRKHYEEPVWQAFLMLVMEDRDPQEVATMQKMSVNAIYKARSRILNRFREEFADLIPDVSDPHAET